MANSREHGNEPVGSIKAGSILTTALKRRTLQHAVGQSQNNIQYPKVHGRMRRYETVCPPNPESFPVTNRSQRFYLRKELWSIHVYLFFFRTAVVRPPSSTV